MNQNAAFFISSQAWTFSTELVIEFLGGVPCEKSNHAFAPTLCPGKILFTKYSSPLRLTSINFLAELARMHPSHPDNLAQL